MTEFYLICLLLVLVLKGQFSIFGVVGTLVDSEYISHVRDVSSALLVKNRLRNIGMEYGGI